MTSPNIMITTDDQEIKIPLGAEGDWEGSIPAALALHHAHSLVVSKHGNLGSSP